MAAAKKAAASPSTRGRKAGTQTQVVTVDWSKATVTDVAMPSRLQKSIVDDTPFPGWYTESWESGQSKQLSGLTEEGAQEAKRLATLSCQRLGKIWSEGGDIVKTGIRHHMVQAEDQTWTYTFLAVDRTKAEEADADSGEEEAAIAGE